jgi:hypothetical protein
MGLNYLRRGLADIQRQSLGRHGASEAGQKRETDRTEGELTE